MLNNNLENVLNKIKDSEFDDIILKRATANLTKEQKADIKRDVYFKCLFGNSGNEKITKSFIEWVTGKKIEYVTTDHKLELERINENDKKMEMDIFAKDNMGEKYILEMQNRYYSYLTKRFTAYPSKAYVQDFKSSEQYDKLNKTTLIVIMYDNMREFDGIDDYKHEVKQYIRNHLDRTFSEEIQIYIFELRKYKKQKKKTGKIEPWLELFIDSKSKEVMNMARTMAEIRAAVDKLHELEADETVSWIAFQETMAHAEEMARREEAVKEGMEEGMKKGMKEGMKEGMTKIAKNMLKDGVKIEDIIKYTGLTNEELEKLRS
ncbi:MAG: Rpn family recombination-promoting nuclease/putative transposase [Clostridia bacterium]|nr:Rpn family recombination-promoting nuclease/putative transposase [Clostridia bacterium]